MFKLSNEGFRLLVETDPVPHVVVNNLKSCQAPATPQALKVLANVPEVDASDVPADGCFVVVFDSDDVEQVKVNKGERAIVYFDARSDAPQELQEPETTDCKSVTFSPNDFLVLDVRRKDEVENFGMLPSAVHLALDDVLRQLASKDHSEKLKQVLKSDKPVVSACRTNRRAKFMAQVLKDLGVESSMYLDKGACGCANFAENKMKAYPSYELTDPVPQPIEPTPL